MSPGFRDRVVWPQADRRLVQVDGANYYVDPARVVSPLDMGPGRIDIGFAAGGWSQSFQFGFGPLNREDLALASFAYLHLKDLVPSLWKGWMGYVLRDAPLGVILGALSFEADDDPIVFTKYSILNLFKGDVR